MLALRTLAPLFGLGLAACSAPAEPALPPAVHADFAAADRLELLSLDPVPAARRDEAAADGAALHGYTILCRAAVTDAAARSELLELVERGIRENDGRVAACFDPRHGLRAERGGHVSELLICYECLSMQIWRDGVQVDGRRTSEGPAPRMDAIWRAHGCEIAAR